MEYYRLPLYILFGILPSLIWLFYYLKKDLHPEPKSMILEVFLYGALATIPVFFLQTQLSGLLKHLGLFTFLGEFPIIINILKWFLIIALTEEILKYFVVRLTVFKNYELDEPLDIILYMIIAALGFATVENILYLFSPMYNNLPFSSIVKATITISFIRFIGATLLHTLCSGLLGYFLAMSFFETRKRLQLTVIGISIAVFLHGLYNFSIITLESPMNFVIPAAIIIGLATFLIKSFDKVKKIKSVSKI